MKYLILNFFIATTLSHFSYGQGGMISGSIKDARGERLPGVFIQLNETETGTVTDKDGQFSIAGLVPGNYSLRASSIGFENHSARFSLAKDQHLNFDIQLKEKLTELNEVSITGKSEATTLKESVAAVSLLEARPLYNRSINTSDLLNTVSGVRVRQNGGVGNSAEISIQGLSGSQVKLFIDGVPMDFLLPIEELGLGASLSMLPINLLKRMEVYKGVVPVSLGADALGGAVNMVTRQDLQEYLEVSGTYSSFNTWQTTLAARRVSPSGLFWGIKGFYNASDNNYRINDVSVINKNGNPENISVRKFHDRFRSYLLQFEVGLLDRNWADKVVLSISYGNLYDEIQHNVEMRQPYGEALNEAQTFNTALQYEKYDVLNKLDMNVYLGYNRILTNFTDTSANIFDWRGVVVDQKSYGGEITTSKNLLELQGDNISGRLNLNYSLTEKTKLISNTVISRFSRTGSDPIAASYYGEDFFNNAVNISKIVSGFSLEQKLFSERLSSSSAIKSYQYQSKGFKIEDGEADIVTQDLFQLGASQSFTFSISDPLLAKLSYEYATRMPGRQEAWGDFSKAISANPGLIPETSHNFNLGVIYNKNTMTVEINGFSRLVDNIIILQAVPPPVMSSYENLLRARVMGIEGEVQVKPKPWLSFRGNATYQDLRSRSKKENAGVSSDRYFNVRLANKPYLFANLEAQAEKSRFLKTDNKLQFWWFAGYVHEFFRFWEIDGRKQDKLTVPTQVIQNLGIAFSTKEERLNISLEAQNIFNERAYDNFRVQRPGRSWHLKIRTFIN